MYFFKSTYEPCAYSPNWYGSFDVAPQAIVLLYDDNLGVCIGQIDTVEAAQILQSYDSITIYATQQELTDDWTTFAIDDPNVWFEDRLARRWDVIKDGV